MEDELIHELSAAYALDALTADEHDVYENHLAGCRRCQADVAAFSETASALAYAVTPADPSAELRDRVLAATRAEEPRLARRRWRTPTLAFAAAAACAAIVLVVSAVTAHSPFGSSHPALETLRLHGASGSLVLTRTGEAALVVSGLPRAAAGKTYEVWVMSGRAAEPAGTFAARPGTVTVHLTRSVPTGSFIGVTVEPAGGSTKPSGTPLFTSTPA